jgi:segregation and condensation protein B
MISDDDVLVGASVKKALEAILIVSDGPQMASTLANALQTSEDVVERDFEELQEEYREHHGFELKKTARGWQFVNAREFAGLVSQFIADGNSARLSQASLEVLAIIAYKQPVTRAQVNEIRGVNSEQIVRNLSVRGLVEDAGADSQSAARLLKTTDVFLEKLGIDDIEELPDLAPFLPARESVAFQSEFQ